MKVTFRFPAWMMASLPNLGAVSGFGGEMVSFSLDMQSLMGLSLKEGLVVSWRYRPRM